MLAETVALVPDVAVVLAIVVILCLRSYLIERTLEVRLLGATILGLVALALWIVFYGEGARILAGGVLIEDSLSRMTQCVVLLASAAALAIGIEGGQRATARDPYVAALVLLAVLGLLIVSSAGDLLVLFLGLQLYALPVYALIAHRENSSKAIAAGLRAALVGTVGSALVLFGIALVIASAGTTLYTELAPLLTDSPGLLLSAGLALLIAGLAFYLALAPFHLWLQPALEAAPWPVVALMVGAAPLALFTALARLVFVAFGDVAALWQPVLAAMGLLSVLAGAIAGFATDRLSHLLAAFATLGAGFGLMALSAGSADGVSAMIAQVALHATALLGFIAFLSLLEKDGGAVERLRDLNGYSEAQMFRAFAALLILFSAAAMPPLAGFLVRFNVVQAMYDSGLIWQSLAGAGAMIVAGATFLRPAWRLYLAADVSDTETRTARLSDLVLVISALVALLSLLSLGGLEAAFEAAGARLER